jgi:hypothetical protein
MFDTNLVINDGTSDRTYALTSIVDGKSIRRDASATLGEPRTLTISHGKRNPKDPESPDRHLVRLDVVDHDAEGVAHTASAYIVVENPVNGLFSVAQLRALLLSVLNAVGDDSVRFPKFMNSEP